MTSLAGKAIIVTGAGRGFAVRAAAQGACVLVNDLTKEAVADTTQIIREAGGRVTSFAGSVADWNVAAELTNRCVNEFGTVDGLVNDAGIHYVAQPWEDEEDQVRALIDVNILGTIFCGMHALKVMVKQRRGSIVNVTSGAHLGMKLRSIYGASKGAVASVTYGWAIDALAYNVRVNALSPVASTPLGDEFPRQMPGFDASADLLPPSEAIAPAVIYLLSDLAEGITGQVVRMTGQALSLMNHPTVGGPVEERDDWRAWDEEAIAVAFDTKLRGALKPVGLIPTSS